MELLGTALQSVEFIKFTHLASDKLGIKLSASMVAEHKSIAAIAAAIQHAEGANRHDLSCNATQQAEGTNKQGSLESKSTDSQITGADSEHTLETTFVSSVSSDAQLPFHSKPVDFSILFFGSDAGCCTSTYQLVIDATILADQNGFTAVWFPERHFQEFGGSFPNPNPMAASLAQLTTSIRLRAGSVNIPQHATPLRVAEDWAVVDNLSSGRVDISFGAGWNVVDFALQPQNFLINKMVLPKPSYPSPPCQTKRACPAPDAYKGRVSLPYSPDSESA